MIRSASADRIDIRRDNMNLNILEISVIIITALLCIIGCQRGFVKKIASILSLVLSVALVSAALPYITDFLKNSTPVYSYIVENCNKVVTEKISESLLGEGNSSEGSSVADYYQSLSRDQVKALLVQNGYDSSIVDTWSDEEFESYKKQYIEEYVMGSSSTSDGSSESADPGDSLSRSEQMEIIDQLPFPQKIRDMLQDYNNTEGYEELNATGFLDYIVNFISTAILNIIAYIVCIILVQLVLRLLLAALNILSHLPLVGLVNRLLGLILGLVEALFLIWLFFLILSMASATGWGSALMDMVNDSTWLTWLYNGNLFVQIALGAAAIF